MTLQTLPFFIPWPRQLWAVPSLVASTLLDAAGEYHAVVLMAEEDMVISHVGIRPNATTGAGQVSARIETVANTGLPSGTLWATNTTGNSSGLSAAWQLIALTASATISKGQIFCVKIQYLSGTSVTMRSISSFNLGSQLPYRVANTGAATKALASDMDTMALGSSTSTFYAVRGLYPVITVTNTTFNNTSSAARANRFQVPFRCRAAGIYWDIRGVASGDYNAVIWNDAGSELSSSSTAMDGDYDALTSSGLSEIVLDSPVTLEPGIWYRAGIEPTSATNKTVGRLTLAGSDYKQAMPGGVNFQGASRASAVWTDVADEVYVGGILIDQLEDGRSPRARSLLGVV